MPLIFEISLKYSHGQNSCIRLHRYPATARIPADTPPGPETSLAVQTGLAWARRIQFVEQWARNVPTNQFHAWTRHEDNCLLCCEQLGRVFLDTGCEAACWKASCMKNIGKLIKSNVLLRKRSKSTHLQFTQVHSSNMGLRTFSCKTNFRIGAKRSHKHMGNPTVWSTTGRMSSFVLK